MESARLNVETKKNVSVDEIFDFSLVREMLKEMGESPKLQRPAPLITK